MLAQPDLFGGPPRPKQDHQFDRRPFRPLQMMYEGRFVGGLGWSVRKAGSLFASMTKANQQHYFTFMQGEH
jgi:hypothetical protein